LADTLGMRPVASDYFFFIYLSFVTAGLWFAVYLTLAFWMRLKDLIRAKRTSVLIYKKKALSLKEPFISILVCHYSI
jgi:predicted membrane protein